MRVVRTQREGRPTPPPRPDTPRKVYILSDCDKALNAATGYIRPLADKSSIEVITQLGFENPLQDFGPGDIGIISLASIEEPTHALEKTLRQITNEITYRRVHVIVPNSARNHSPIVQHIREYCRDLLNARFWQGFGRFYFEVGRFIPAS